MSSIATGQYKITNVNASQQGVNQRLPGSLTIIGEPIQFITNGSVVEVLGNEFVKNLGSTPYTWVHVKFDGKNGYVAKSVLTWTRVNVSIYDMYDYIGLGAGVEGNSKITVMDANFAAKGENIQVQQRVINGVWKVRHVKGHNVNAANCEEFEFKNGAVFRTWDSSPGGSELYAVNNFNGAVWLNRYMSPGDRVYFNVTINWFNRFTGEPIPGKESIYFPHYIEFVNHHSSWRGIDNVIELRSYFPNGTSFERYWYANSSSGYRGLVGWRDESGHNLESWGASQKNSDQMQIIEVPWKNIRNWGSSDEQPVDPPLQTNPLIIGSLLENHNFEGTPKGELGESLAVPKKWNMRVIQHQREDGSFYPTPFIFNDPLLKHWIVEPSHRGFSVIFEPERINWLGGGKHVFVFNALAVPGQNSQFVGNLRWYARVTGIDGKVYRIPFNAQFNAENHSGKVYVIPVYIPETNYVQKVEFVVEVLPEHAQIVLKQLNIYDLNLVRVKDEFPTPDTDDPTKEYATTFIGLAGSEPDPDSTDFETKALAKLDEILELLKKNH